MDLLRLLGKHYLHLKKGCVCLIKGKRQQTEWIALQSYGLSNTFRAVYEKAIETEADSTAKMTRYFAHNVVLGKNISSQCSMNWNEPVSTGVT